MECFISEETGEIYLPGLEKALQGTTLEYCALRQFYERTAIHELNFGRCAPKSQ